MKIAFTGHRPNKLGGYDDKTNLKIPVMRAVKAKLLEIGGDITIISGMAIGVDQWIAELAIRMGYPLHAYIPFVGQESKWPASSQKRYNQLLERVTEIKIITEGGYDPSKMHRRNRAMVDSCDLLIAIWDGSPGGTGHCIDYAYGNEVPVYRIHPSELKRDPE